MILAAASHRSTSKPIYFPSFWISKGMNEVSVPARISLSSAMDGTAEQAKPTRAAQAIKVFLSMEECLREAKGAASRKSTEEGDDAAAIPMTIPRLMTTR